MRLYLLLIVLRLLFLRVPDIYDEADVVVSASCFISVGNLQITDLCVLLGFGRLLSFVLLFLGKFGLIVIIAGRRVCGGRLLFPGILLFGSFLLLGGSLLFAGFLLVLVGILLFSGILLFGGLLLFGGMLLFGGFFAGFFFRGSLLFGGFVGGFFAGFFRCSLFVGGGLLLGDSLFLAGSLSLGGRRSHGGLGLLSRNRARISGNIG